MIRLCEQHSLLSALAHIYNAMRDYRTPLLALLRAAAAAPDGPAAAVAGYKALVYLRCMFRGQPFPPPLPTAPRPSDAPRSGSADAHALSQAGTPGAGGAAGADAAGSGAAAQPPPRDEMRAQALGLLLFLTTEDLAREWGEAADRVRARVVDPHPALQLLLKTDAAATVQVGRRLRVCLVTRLLLKQLRSMLCSDSVALVVHGLRRRHVHPRDAATHQSHLVCCLQVLDEALDGWDAVETDLRAAAGQPAPEELESVLVATQLVVNALLSLLNVGAFRPAAPHSAAQPLQPHAGCSGADVCRGGAVAGDTGRGSGDGGGLNGVNGVNGGGGSAASRALRLSHDLSAALRFVVGLAVAGRVLVPPACALQLLQYLAQRSLADGPADPMALQRPKASREPAVAAGGSQQRGRDSVPWDAVPGAAAGSSRGRAAGAAADALSHEAMFIKILEATGVNADGQPCDPQRLSAAQAGAAMALAQQAGFGDAVAVIHHLRGDYGAALQCCLEKDAPGAAFEYIDRCAGGSSRAAPLLTCFCCTYHMNPTVCSAVHRQVRGPLLVCCLLFEHASCSVHFCGVSLTVPHTTASRGLVRSCQLAQMALSQMFCTAPAAGFSRTGRAPPAPWRPSRTPCLPPPRRSSLGTPMQQRRRCWLGCRGGSATRWRRWRRRRRRSTRS